MLFIFMSFFFSNYLGYYHKLLSLMELFLLIIGYSIYSVHISISKYIYF